MKHNIYIASCTEEGGIFRYCMDEEGKLEFLDKTPCKSPMYMVLRDGRMQVILRAPFADSSDSALTSFLVDKDGSLSDRTPLLSTRGEVACHLCAHDFGTYCVNYISGSVIRMPDTLVVHYGCGVSLPRQEGPHTHFVGVTPDNRYILVTDLGLDTVFVYTPELTLHSRLSVPKGHGARHLVFSQDGRYMFVVNELASTVSSFEYCEGEFGYIDTVACLPEECPSIASAIRYHQGRIYVANRGHDSISVLEHDGGRMKLTDNFSCGGHYPRDFDFVGDYIISANERGNSVAVIHKDSHREVCRVDNIAAPLCVLVVEI